MARDMELEITKCSWTACQSKLDKGDGQMGLGAIVRNHKAEKSKKKNSDRSEKDKFCCPRTSQTTLTI
jgi:hypothetical protein